ncbi:hypothetical protein NQZ68_011417, partial [Dissostichus eleginoides]
PGSIEREPQSPAGVHQTPPFLGEKHRGRNTHTALDLQPTTKPRHYIGTLVLKRRAAAALKRGHPYKPAQLQPPHHLTQ